MSLKQDLKKLRAYAKSLGVSISIKKNLGDGDAGYFYFDREEPLVAVAHSDDTDTILTLLHELGHALDWFKNLRRLRLEDSRVVDKDYEKMSEGERFTLYEYESRAIANMHLIWKVLDLSIPEYKVLAEQRHDRWQYMNFAHFGSFPRKAQRRAQRARFRTKVREELAREARRNRFANI